MTEVQQGDVVEQRERARMSAPELSWALREVNRAAADVDRALAARLGLRPLDYAAMGHVMNAPEPIGPAELSQRLGISSGSGTELVDRLERAGHIQRQRHEVDRRRVVIQPVPAAVERLLGELGSLFADIDDLAETFTGAEQQVVARYLRSAARRMRDYAASEE